MKTRIAYSIFLSALLLTFFSCSKAPKPDEFLVKGNFKNTPPTAMVYLKEISTEGTLIIDSVKVSEKGDYSFLRKFTQQSLYQVWISNTEFVTILPRGAETITIAADYKTFSESYTISGSPESKLLWELNKKTLEGIADMTALSKQWKDAATLGEEEKKQVQIGIKSSYIEILHSQRQFVSDFIDKNQGSLVTLSAIYKTFNQEDLISPEKNPQDIAIYKKVLKGLEEKQPANPHTIKFKAIVAKYVAIEAIKTQNQPAI